jgi:thymidylate synthase (FAD)
MNVRLIAVTAPQFEINDRKPSAEELMVYCARVSSPQNQDNLDTAPKLLRYCARNGHWSIFEQSNMILEVTTSRAISAQILRHSFLPQEFSQRYAEVVSCETYEARRQDTKNRQNSIPDLPHDVQEWFKYAQQQVQDLALELYQKALDVGIAKESARFLLPMSATTTLYLNNSVRGWIHYLQSRTHESTQKEHRDIAFAALEIFKQQFPWTYEAVFAE